MIADRTFTNQQMVVTGWKLHQVEVYCIDAAAQKWELFICVAVIIVTTKILKAGFCGKYLGSQEEVVFFEELVLNKALTPMNQGR
jgi:hypothetical protein